MCESEGAGESGAVVSTNQNGVAANTKKKGKEAVAAEVASSSMSCCFADVKDLDLRRDFSERFLPLRVLPPL